VVAAVVVAVLVAVVVVVSVTLSIGRFSIAAREGREDRTPTPTSGGGNI